MSDLTVVPRHRVAASIPEGTARVLVMGVNYWGAGTTYVEAHTNFGDAGGDARKGLVVICYPGGCTRAYVDGMGRTQSEWDLEVPFEHRVPLATLGVRGTETSF